MKKYLFLYWVLFQTTLSFGQKHDNIWPMGYNYDSCTFYIDFTDSFEIVPTCLGIEFINISNASICDSLGNLLFYSNGNRIANRNHQIMANGYGINNTNNIDYIDGYPSKTLILPKPNSNNLFYLFHTEYLTNGNGLISYINAVKFNYSLIDLNYNNGIGEVVLKNIPILNDTIGGGGNLLTACKHANGIDWWVLISKFNSNKYYKFLLTEDSILGPFNQELGYSFSWIDYNGQDVFSPDGSLYVRYDPQNQAHLYDFNRCTGELSYRQQINVSSNINGGGAAISANSRFLYIANDTIVFQYDLQAADINASRITVGSNASFWQMQLAPDGKIYGIALGGTDRMHVIENPDSAGLVCNFRQYAIATPLYNGFSLPNFPHFRTPALAPGACDTTGVLVLPVVKERIKIYPNPSHNGRFNIVTQQSSPDYVQVHDLLGRLLLQEAWDAYETEKELQLPSGAKGIYFVSVWKEGKLVGREKIIILE